MPFPRNYALLFACSVVGNIGSLIAFLCVHEPIRPVQKKRKSFWQHVEQGPRLLKTDVNYRRFLFFRVFMGISEMAMPFYVPYALLRFGVPESIIGSFVVVLALSEVISNALWGYIGEKYGVRFILIGASALGCLSPLIAISVQFLPPPWRAPSYFLIFAVNGVAGNGVMVGFMTYMLNLAPPKIRPTYLGFLNTLLFPFSFLPVLAGKLVKGFAVNALFFSVPIPGIDYEGVFVVSLIAGMCAFLMSRQLKDVYHPEDMYGQENSLEKRD
jgi:MFS family permease